MTKERIAFVDYIRVVACLLVMVVHASEQFYNMGPISQVANEDNRLWVSIYDGFFGRISVPLFMIVSAFLLVPMREGMTMSQFYHRRFLRILPPFVCFLVLYAVLPAFWGGLTWDDAIEQLEMVPFNFPLWGGHLPSAAARMAGHPRHRTAHLPMLCSHYEVPLTDSGQ